ncbi:hypothetical protein [Actinoplanes sichuanensis]|uniref:PEP-CTERM protein-sorting domain-containing protein n=1 Tax=Actinoplanes sichuanensis TaxID=512349 RepID=A0ABW4AT50_9ACTN|nr:hypothetical protein [Actinoplanes sichuanensis]
MIRSSLAGLFAVAQRRAAVTALSLVFLGTTLAALTGLAIEQTSSVDPSPFVVVIGAATGVGTVMFLRRAAHQGR